MALLIPDLLSPADLAEVRRVLDAAEWADGRITAGTQSSLVKHNQQLPEDSPVATTLRPLVLAALARNALFQSAVLPRRIYPPLFNRYGVGMGFGDHVDNALRGPDFLRTDVSCTIFLDDPATYDGGRLVIDDALGSAAYAGPAGSAIVYPGTTLHRVEPVTRGVRRGCFFWVQSLVRRAQDRAVLHDLDLALAGLRRRGLEGQPELVALTGVYHNLLRTWAEP